MEQDLQTFLPTQFGGLQLQCPATTAPLARVAHLIENGHHIRDAMSRWADRGLTAAAPDTYDGVEGGDFETLARALDGLRISFDPSGLPTPWTRPLQPQDLRIPAPRQHILSAANRTVSARRYAELLDRPWCPEMDGADEPEPDISDGETTAMQRRPDQATHTTQNGPDRPIDERVTQTAQAIYDTTSGRQCERVLHLLDMDATALAHEPTMFPRTQRDNSDPHDGPPITAEPWKRRCVRLRSAAGPTAGRLWAAQAGAPGTNLTDAEWRTATRYRLGIPLGPGRYHCQNRASDPDALRPTCGTRLGGFGCHALCCSYGPLRNTHHNEMADLVARMSQEAVATPIREFQTDRPAILDVTAFGTAEVVDLIIDVTVRHPTCQKYGRTDQETERAAIMAEAEKQTRYPPAAGRRVTTFAIETWGRLGPEAEHVLQQLAGAARRRDQQRDRLALNRIPKWRALIDATNQRSIARRLLGAFLGTDGKPWRPHPPKRDPAHDANTNRLGPGEPMTYPHTNVDPDRLQFWASMPYNRNLTGDRPDSYAGIHQNGPERTHQHQAAQPRQHSRTTNAVIAPHTQQHDGPTPTEIRPPPTTQPHGSELPPDLHAVNTRENARPAGHRACDSGRPPYCVLCLVGYASEGPNVCASKATDSIIETLPPSQHTDVLRSVPTERDRRQTRALEPDATTLGRSSICLHRQSIQIESQQFNDGPQRQYGRPYHTASQ